MNIRAIRLQNFRGFQDAHIELKPLTVLLGPNSSGKSSFGQALAAMAHVHKYYVSTPQASLTPPPQQDVDAWPVDLGDTDDLRTEGAEGPVIIGLQTNGGWVELGFGGLTHTSDLLISYFSHPSGERSAPTTPSNMVLTDVPKSQTSDVVLVEGVLHDMRSTKELRQSIDVRKINENQWQEGTTAVSVALNGLLITGVEHTSGTARILSGVARNELRAFLEHLTYLRANRKRPSRGYTPGVGKQQPIGYSGEWAPSILLKNGLEQVTYCVPPAIPNSVGEAQQSNPEWKTTQEALSDALNAWLLRLEIAKRVETVAPTTANNVVRMRVALKGQSAHDITETGLGVSQVIPVLIAGLLQPKDSLFIVDLPEAHLHPRPQGALADFFCSLALSGRTALVETHSEMFFHRLRLRAAQDPTLMDKIAVYFIDAPEDGICSTPRAVGLRQEDYLRWPETFLLEAWEMETQLQSIRQARDSQR